MAETFTDLRAPVPVTMKRELKIRAAHEGVSMASLVRTLLRDGLDARAKAAAVNRRDRRRGSAATPNDDDEPGST